MSDSVIPDSKCVCTECVQADMHMCMLYMYMMRNEDKVQFIYH